MSLIDPESEVIIQSLSFPGEGTVEVTFLEKRDQKESVGMVKTIFVDIRAARLRTVHAEVLELCQEIVDAGLLLLRSPADDLDPRKRFRKDRKDRISADTDEDDTLDTETDDQD